MMCVIPSLEHTQLSMVRKATGISSIAASEYSLVWNTRNFTTKILILQIDLKLNDDYTIHMNILESLIYRIHSDV